MDETNNIQQPVTQVKTPIKKPNEIGGFNISGSVKIFDPETKEIYVEVRA